MSRLDDLPMARKIRGETAQFATLRIRESHTDDVALHDLANARRDFLKQVMQLQLGHNSIGHVQEQLQSLLRASVIYCEGDLIRNQSQEPLILRGIRVLKVTGKTEASQLP